jgi:hypothetical protein
METDQIRATLGLDLPEHRLRAWHFYGFAGLAPDRYPLYRRKDGTLGAHPIHGSYLLRDYISVATQRKGVDANILEEALRLAKASVARADRVDDTYCFMYRQSEGVSSYPFDFYSALTQAHYLVAFALLYELTGQEWLLSDARLLFRSLTVPVEAGGVLLRTDRGVFFEEYPTEVPLYVLNGWLTVLTEVLQYADICRDPEARDLARESTRTLVSLLPTFDVPEWYNSRYKLTGPVLQRIRFDPDCLAEIRSVTVETGGLTYSKRPPFSSHRYGTLQVIHLPTPERNKFQFCAAISMAEYPRPSRVTVAFSVDRPCIVRWSMGIPRSDTRRSTVASAGFRDLEQYSAGPGENEVTLTVPWDLGVAWCAEPTKFSKLYEGKYYNVYHYLHIWSLTQLHAVYSLPKLLYWRDRWLAYVDQWGAFPPYMNHEFGLDLMPITSSLDTRAYLTTPQWTPPK